MTNEGVRNLIARLISDEYFYQKFFRDPTETIKNSGYSIDAKEADALAKLKPEDLKVQLREMDLDIGSYRNQKS